MSTRSRVRVSAAQPSFEEALFYEPIVADGRAAESGLPIFRVQLVRDSRSDDGSLHTVRSPEDAARVFAQYLQGSDREHFVVMMLDTKSRVIGLNTVSVGTLDQTLVHPREVFKPAILANASSLIVCHNHPSGDPQPSPEDNHVTAKLAEAAKIIGIDLLDHIVIGANDKHCSLKQLGLL
jgi:DNA repair protein RadC